MMDIESLKNHAVQKFSTFKIGGEAKCLWRPKSESEFIELLNKLNDFYIVSAGSNILFSSDFIDKDIILTADLDKFDIKDNILVVQAGVKGAQVANILSQQGLSGLEFLIGFPAKMGGAIYQNASAQGQAIEDTFLEAKIFDTENKKFLTFSKTDMQFSYRHSVLNSGKYVLIEAKFLLKKVDKKISLDLIQKNISFRKLHQPMLSLPNIGSIFKNPENNSAGKLLDECGFKGFKVGGAQVWDNHANFIVNVDNATSLDVLNLMCKMKEEVFNKFCVNLVPEIKFLCGINKKEEELWKLLQK